jgi:PAS domain S-box-containing protein
MIGKSEKKLLATGLDDAQQTINQLCEEIEDRFGVCPSFFMLAQYEPPIAINLFRFAEFAYLDSPIPAHFKERLFTWLSRFCEVRYCVARHCAFLLGRGRVAGDASAPPLSAEQALSLLKELMPTKDELPEYLRALEETTAPLGDWPDFDSDLGHRLRVACAVVFLNPSRAAPWMWEMRRLLGPQRYEQLMLFLAFVRTAHFWTEVHPELAFEPDLVAMLREHEALAEPLLHSADDAARWELGQRLYDEMQSLRESQKNIDALHDSEARFRAIFENAAVGIARVAPDGRFLEVNQRLCDIVGYTCEELMAKTFADITHPDDLEQDLREMGRMLAGEFDTYLRQKRYYHKNGFVVWVNLTVSLMRKADGSPGYFISVIEDITARKQAEAEREQLAEEQVARGAAEAANRSKDEFLAMVSHELRSPLNAILGYTRMLRSGPVDRDAINNITAIVERSAKAQLQIIEDLLDSARIITGKLRIEPAPIDLIPVLKAALDTVRSAAEAKGVTLIADFGLMPEQSLGDSTRLQQVVWNLLTNAIKFTPEGGRVELRMESDVDSVRITVSDTGKGIEPEFMPFVFDSFRQADPSSVRRYGGLGLGLSLVKHLVELHGGTITGASKGVGRGATFTVTLPRRHFEIIAAPTPAVAPREVRTEGAITIDQDLSLESVSVLVVDDQQDSRDLLIQTLSGYGAQVTAVSSGVEALAFLSDPPDGKRPDALILDIAMPDEDGYTVLKKVRALEAEQGAADRIPAIALTAYGRSEDRLRALQAGFQMHVTKPVDPAELAVVIASLTTMRAWEPQRKE